MELGTTITIVTCVISLIITIVKTSSYIVRELTSLRESLVAIQAALAKIEKSSKEEILAVKEQSEKQETWFRGITEKLFGLFGNLDNRVTRIETKLEINGSGGSWPGTEVGQI